MRKYVLLLGGIAFLVLARNCIAAPVAEVSARTAAASHGVAGEVVLAKAVATPGEDRSQVLSKECMAVTMYEEQEEATQGALEVRVAYGFTFSPEYPLTLCSIQPLNTA